MMRAKTEQKVKRWKDQRWLIDTVIQAVGMEWDQPRLNYTMYPAGVDAIGDFRTVGTRVRKFADMHREFAAAGHRREIKAQGFEKQGRTVSARESYFIAALLYSAARWPIFENNEKSIAYNERMVACYDKFAAMMNRPVIRVEVPFGDKSLPGYLHLPHEPKPGERFPVTIGIDGMDAPRKSCARCTAISSSSAAWRILPTTGPGKANALTAIFWSLRPITWMRRAPCTTG